MEEIHKMEKAVLMSIHPKWCELIVCRLKTVEVRKNRPNIDGPFKVYIYETKAKDHYGVFHENTIGKVIGEFVCDYIEDFKEFEYGIDALHRHIKLNACIDYRKIYDYLGFAKCGYGWHISNLVIYATPRELSEFTLFNSGKPVEKPPQSWFYVAA